jgi:hypothetical protein
MEHLSVLEEFCEKLNSGRNSLEIKEANDFLTSFVTLANFQTLKILLYKSNLSSAKFYAANSLTQLITQNYLTVDLDQRREIYDSILMYIVSNFNYLSLCSKKTQKNFL